MLNTKNLHELYNQDTFLWYNENARLLRERKFDQLDIERLAEEITSMGKNEEDKLESYLRILFIHLLKWKYQPNYSGKKSWLRSIFEHRRRAKKHLMQNPSLKGHIAEIAEDAYRMAAVEAVNETNLDSEIFPEEMPFTLEEALTEGWLPE